MWAAYDSRTIGPFLPWWLEKIICDIYCLKTCWPVSTFQCCTTVLVGSNNFNFSSLDQPPAKGELQAILYFTVYWQRIYKPTHYWVTPLVYRAQCGLNWPILISGRNLFLLCLMTESGPCSLLAPSLSFGFYPEPIAGPSKRITDAQ